MICLPQSFPRVRQLNSSLDASRHSRLSDHMMYFRDYVQVVTTTQVVTLIIWFRQESRYNGTQNAGPEIASPGACKLLCKVLHMNPHGLLDISDSVALCFVHLNSVVLPGDSQGSDNGWVSE